jgi:hypothetical protein
MALESRSVSREGRGRSVLLTCVMLARGQRLASDLPETTPRNATRSTTRPRFGRAIGLDCCGVARGAAWVRVGAALRSHGRGHSKVPVCCGLTAGLTPWSEIVIRRPRRPDSISTRAMPAQAQQARSNSALRTPTSHHAPAFLLWCNGLLREGSWWALPRGSLDGMQEVRGSNPLSSTPAQRPCAAWTGLVLAASGSRSAAIGAPKGRSGRPARADASTVTNSSLAGPSMSGHRRSCSRHG